MSTFFFHFQSTRTLRDSFSVNYQCNKYTCLGYFGQPMILDFIPKRGIAVFSIDSTKVKMIPYSTEHYSEKVKRTKHIFDVNM